jgi:hypothetical protein
MNIVERSFPDANPDVARYQILVAEQRPVQVPVFRGKEIIGHQDGMERVQVLRLVGFGATEREAKACAAAALRARATGIEIEP